VRHQELDQQPRWLRTGDPCFPVAAKVGGSWWVLRVNNFPDHPLWTLLVEGERRFDVDDAPPSWGRPADPTSPALPASDIEEALGPVRAFVAYGSEIGQPCDNPFCCG
jgi:hypothetical protein